MSDKVTIEEMRILATVAALVGSDITTTTATSVAMHACRVAEEVVTQMKERGWLHDPNAKDDK